MKIVILDGYTENPGDLSWDGLNRLGEVTVYDRTSYTESPLIAERIGDAEAVIINKTPISRKTIDSSHRFSARSSARPLLLCLSEDMPEHTEQHFWQNPRTNRATDISEMTYRRKSSRVCAFLLKNSSVSPGRESAFDKIMLCARW